MVLSARVWPCVKNIAVFCVGKICLGMDLCFIEEFFFVVSAQVPFIVNGSNVAWTCKVLVNEIVDSTHACGEKIKDAVWWVQWIDCVWQWFWWHWWWLRIRPFLGAFFQEAS